MRIVGELINNPRGGSRGVDWRWNIWEAILKKFKSLGHEIYGDGIKPKCLTKNGFKIWNGEEPDFFISFSPYAGERAKRAERYHGKMVVYDHGWLYKSLVVDRNKLFGDSYYCDKIGKLIEENYNPDKLEKYRLDLLNNHISKRPQKQTQKIPKIPYIFVPFQVLYDVSVVHYSKTGMLELVSKVIDFASRHGIHVIGKLHPGMTSARHGKDECHKFCKEMTAKHKNFQIIDTSIFDLMKNALFTACISSGSIIDNIISHTPVYICGRTFFNKSGTVIANENVEDGLKTMIKKDYDKEKMIDKQKKLLWWLRKNMIQEEYSVDKNIKLLEFHSGIKLV